MEPTGRSRRGVEESEREVLAITPPSYLSGKGAAALLQCLRSTAPALDAPDELGEALIEGVSRKDKSLGLLCDNFLQLFASGYSGTVELETVASRLGVGRRRIYDIVNVLESLDVVLRLEDRAASYEWLGMSRLDDCLMRLTAMEHPVKLITEEPICGKENGDDEGASLPIEKEKEGRKEKSIRELSVKFVGLFLQAAEAAHLEGILSLELAARSLLFHERGVGVSGGEPEAGAMKTKVRRLYDICNVLTSLRMIEKVKLPATCKPAFKWLGVTPDTRKVFDSSAAKSRIVRQYGGGTNAPVCSKRKLAQAAESRRVLGRAASAIPSLTGCAASASDPGGASHKQEATASTALCEEASKTAPTIESRSRLLILPEAIKVPPDPYEGLSSTKTEGQAAPTPTQQRTTRSRQQESTAIVPMELGSAGTPRSASSANTLLFLAGVVATPS